MAWVGFELLIRAISQAPNFGGQPIVVPRSSVRLGASQVLAATFAVVGERFFCELVQPARSNVGFNLAIPQLGIELGKPSAKLGKPLRREPANRCFNIMHAAHISILYAPLAKHDRHR